MGDTKKGCGSRKGRPVGPVGLRGEGRSPITDLLSRVKPGFLHTPLASHADEDEEVKGAPRDEDVTAELIREEKLATLSLKYLMASPGQEFMVGQVLPFGSGVSWAPIMQQDEVRAAARRDALLAGGENGGKGGVRRTSASLSDFYEALDLHLKARQERFRDLFDRFDVHKKGHLNATETAQLISEVLPESSAEGVAALAKILDVEGSGQVSMMGILDMAKDATLDKKTRSEESERDSSVGAPFKASIGSGSNNPPKLLIADISTTERIVFFRGGATAANLSSRGSFLAIPLLGLQNHVVGLLAVDTMAAASAYASLAAVAAQGGHGGFSTGQLSSQAADYLELLAAAASSAILRDQCIFEEATLKTQLLGTSLNGILRASMTGSAEDEDSLDPQPYADFSGMRAFKDAVSMLSDLTDEDLLMLRELDHPDTAVLAIVKSALLAAGGNAEGDWSELRLRIDRDLIRKLAKLDPNGQVTWFLLCKFLRPLHRTETVHGRLHVSTSKGGTEEGSSWASSPHLHKQKSLMVLGKWMAAVRSITAASTVIEAMVEKMKVANRALIRAFQGDQGTNALVELRSYRVPPKITLKVLQALLQICGHTPEECDSWGRMRALTSYKMIKSLTEVKPREADGKIIKMCLKVCRSVDEEDVRKESVATLTLFKWLENFAALGKVLMSAREAS